MTTLIAWPEKPKYDPLACQEEVDSASLDYQRARAEAAIQRLRVAVEALRTIHSYANADESDRFYDPANNALQAIGEIPE